MDKKHKSGMKKYESQFRRTKDLSIPNLRILISNKEEYKDVVGPYWECRFNKYIDNYFNSVYTKPGKLELPRLKEKTKTWSRKDKQRHLENVERLSRPQLPKIPHKSKKSKKRKPINMRLINILAEPKSRKKKFGTCKVVPNVKKSALNYLPTERICLLSTPLNRDKGYVCNKEEPVKTKRKKKSFMCCG